MKLGLVNGDIGRRLDWEGDQGDGVFLLLDKTLLLFWQTALSLQLLSEVLQISFPYLELSGLAVAVTPCYC